MSDVQIQLLCTTASEFINGGGIIEPSKLWSLYDQYMEPLGPFNFLQKVNQVQVGSVYLAIYLNHLIWLLI